MEMQNEMNSQIKFLALNDLHTNFLNHFNRYQKTTHVFYIESSELKSKDDFFEEIWNATKKREITQTLRECLLSGGAVVGAYIENQLVGFANIENSFFGTKKEYIELPFIHVSFEHRKHGIGRKLFHKCCERAKQMGAKKLYIAAHPSIETQKFYRNVGCTLAKEINKDILNKEPLDIQLEKIL